MGLRRRRAGSEVLSGTAIERIRRGDSGLFKAGVVVVAKAGTTTFFVHHIYTGILFVVTLAA